MSVNVERRHPARRAAAALALVLVISGCSSTVAGTAVRVGTGQGTQSQDPPPDGPNGFKQDAPPPTVTATDADPDGNEYDKAALDTISDLYAFYSEQFPKQFDMEFTPAKDLVSFSSRDNERECGIDLFEVVNAMYVGACDTIMWDRAVLLPLLDDAVGELATPTVLAHEMGHLVQRRLKAPRTSTLVFEQQADCYAGAYWRWVADGNSQYFNFSQGEGMRQMLSAMMWIGDQVGTAPDTDGAHGSAFDRTFAASLGYANGLQRCHEISQDEVDQRIQELGFSRLPTNYSNEPITEDFVRVIADLLDAYFKAELPGYVGPKLEQYEGDDPPSCSGTTPQAPVDYCPATKTVRYSLSGLAEIGAAPKDWTTNKGDFSAIILLASRYALAAQSAGGAPVTGNEAGLRALCYAGTWASWMKQPQGPKRLQLSPNDLNKAVYEVVTSSFAAGDVNSKTGTTVLQQVQALHIGVLSDMNRCFTFYGGTLEPTGGG